LAGNSVNGSGNGARSGAQTLTLLAAPLVGLVLQALAEGPKRQAELQQEAGFPAQSALRTQLKTLALLGAVEKSRPNRFPGAFEYFLTPAGEDLRFVADVLERWLRGTNGDSLELGDGPAKATTKALAEGWSTTILRVLAAGPLALTELDRVISSLSYPSVERRLAAMRTAKLVEPLSTGGRATPYAVTDLARSSVAPLAAAARWEQHHLAEAAPPLAPLDVEATFLLAVPLLQLPTDSSGSCRMAVEISSGGMRRLAGATIAIEDGVATCTTRLQPEVDAWALGPLMAWLSALIEPDPGRLELGGDHELSRLVINGLHRSLFAVPSKKSI
jgi:DNA-binding HxlR family transcriptional regulator